MEYSLVISAASAVISASAFVVAFLNYRVSRKLPNENKLFEEKFRSYRSIVAAMNTAAATYLQSLFTFEELSSSSKKSGKVKADLEYELDKVYALLEDTVHEQLLVVPDPLLDPLDKFLELLDNETILESLDGIKDIEKYEAQLNTVFDLIVNAMREDLALDRLDFGLKQRIGGRQRPYIANIISEE